MRDWNSEKILDDVLRYLTLYYFRNDDDQFGYIPYEQLWKYLDSRSIYQSECLSLILFLSRDNKIDIYPPEVTGIDKAPQKVRLNFEGKMFFDAGGYKQKKTDTENERIYKSNYDTNVLQQTKGLNRATWGVVIATTCLVLVEILSWTGCGH